VSRTRRLTVALIVALVVAAGISLGAAARTNGFRDEFTTFDTGRWLVSSRPFGHGTLEPGNVGVADGQLGIRLPGGTVNGGEMRSRSLYRFGTYRARIRVANAPSSLTAFFLYRAPDYQQELDIELYNDSTGRVMFSTYSGGAQTNTRTVLMGFDPTADFHEYAVEYQPNSVRFLVDGAPLQTWSSGIPKSAMNVFVNAWFPSWLAGQAPDSDRFTSVDWLEYSG
jgi:beta-glucanase (GH16 family)